MILNSIDKKDFDDITYEQQLLMRENQLI